VVHVVDVSGMEGRDPFEDYIVIRREMEMYHPSLAEKEEIIVGNKLDLVHDGIYLEELKKKFSKMGKEISFISAVTGENMREFVQRIWKKLEELKERGGKEDEVEDDVKDVKKLKKKVKPVHREIPSRIRMEIVKIGDGIFEVRGEEVEHLIRRINLEHRDGLEYLLNILERSGLSKLLERKGAKPGDTVYLGGREFEYR